MSIGDFLFGSDPETRTQELDKLSPEQRAALDELMIFLGGGNPDVSPIQGLRDRRESIKARLESLESGRLSDSRRQELQEELQEAGKGRRLRGGKGYVPPWSQEPTQREREIQNILAGGPDEEQLADLRSELAALDSRIGDMEGQPGADEPGIPGISDEEIEAVESSRGNLRDVTDVLTESIAGLQDQDTGLIDLSEQLLSDDTSDLSSVLEQVMGRAGQGTGLEDLDAVLQDRIGTDTGVEGVLGNLQDLSTNPERLDEFFRTTIQDPLMEDFEEDIIPGIGRRFGGANFFSGDRRQAEQDAMGELMQQLERGRVQSQVEIPIQAAGAISDLSGQRQNIRSQRAGDVRGNVQAGEDISQSRFGQAADIGSILENLQTQRIGMAGDLRARDAEADLSRAGSQSALASIIGDFAGRDIDLAGRDRLAREEQRARRIRQTLASLGVPVTENVVTADQGQEGNLGEVLTGIGSMVAAFSDRRLKRAIRQIGDIAGLPLYAFKYLWDNTLRIGHMADEVAKVRPDAVMEHQSGFLMVDYGRLYGGDK